MTGRHADLPGLRRAVAGYGSPRRPAPEEM
jgi:hypothetical protein